jgi:RHS repeat-associated protein
LEFIPASGTTGTGAIGTIEFDRPDGSRPIFQHVNGLWQASPDNPSTLTEQDDINGVPTGYTAFTAESRQTERYSAKGLLLSITTASGAVTTLQYSTTSTPTTQAPKPGLLLTVTDPNGRALGFSYDASARLINVALPDGGNLAYAYDSNGRLASVTYPDSHSRQYVYNEASLYVFTSQVQTALTGVIDEKGTRYETTSYNSQGHATSTWFANNIDKYSANGGTNTPLGGFYNLNVGSAQGVYNNHGSNEICGNECNQPWSSIGYDVNGYASSYTDFNGNVTNVTHNAVGLETQRIEAKNTTAQRTTNTTWDSTLRVPLTSTILNASGTTVAQSGWVYNARGQALASCDMDPTIPAAAGYVCSATGTLPAGVRRTLTTYCDTVDSTQCPIIGLLLTQRGPRTDVNDTTTYAYYLTDSSRARHGDLKTVTDPLGHTTTILAYDGAGRILSTQDANGVVTTFTYKPRGWLASRSVAGATTTLTYTPFGAVETAMDADGVVVTYTYDDAHRLTKITDGLGNSIQYTLDVAGNRTAESVYPAGSTTSVHALTRTFNKLGQLTTVVDGLNHTVFNAGGSGNYDNNGNLVLSSDALGIQHKETVDALNRVVSRIDNYNGSGTTQNSKTAYQYDSLDRLIQITDPSNLNTTYGYDGLSNETSGVSPDTGITSSTFDVSGNMLSRTDAKGVAATMTYDALSRPLTVNYPDSTQNITYAYDEPNSTTGCSSSYPVGRLTRIIESAVTTVYCYDALGRVTQKQNVTAAATRAVGYGYTAAGRLSGITSPDGSLVSYVRDGDGRVQSISATPVGGISRSVVSGITYQPFGPISGYTLGNGQTITRVVDANYRLTDLTSPAFNLHVTRDAMGDITAIGNAVGANPATETYSYDPLYRLNAITEAGGTVLEGVTYNPAGDRVTKTGSGLDTGAYSYHPSTHQLVAIGNSALAVDADGNTTAISQSGSTYGFGYSDRNRMTVVQLAGSTIANYTYDALGQRIQKVTNGQTESYVYNEAGQLLAEYGTTNRDYIWMDDIPVANIDTINGVSTTTYVTADQLGTARAVADANGNTLWLLPYQGNSWTEQSPTSNGYIYNLGFSGQYFDAESKLYYNDNRYYCSGCGRYLQPDPTGLAGGINPYVYVANGPLGVADPYGLSFDSWMNQNFPKGDVFRVTGSAIAADTAYAVAVATGNQHLKESALAGMEQDISGQNGGEAAVYLMLSGRGGEGETGGLADLNLRVSEVHGELDPIAQSMRTTAGLDTVEGQRIFGAGAKRDLSPAQRDSLQAGEFSTKCPGAHAEITTLRSAAANGLTPWKINASRPFCPNCAATIQESGGVLTSPSTAYWPKQ